LDTLVVGRERKPDRQTDRKTDGQKKRQTDRQEVGRTDRHMSSGDGLGMTFKYSRLGVVCVRVVYRTMHVLSFLYGKANKEMRVNYQALTKHYFHW
jgi:hypothetical protein